jgi:hypothetical protein
VQAAFRPRHSPSSARADITTEGLVQSSPTGLPGILRPREFYQRRASQPPRSSDGPPPRSARSSRASTSGGRYTWGRYVDHPGFKIGSA